jgi:hypothetical protein
MPDVKDQEGLWGDFVEEFSLKIEKSAFFKIVAQEVLQKTICVLQHCSMPEDKT